MWRVATSSLCVIEVIYNLPSSLPTNSNFSPRVLLDVFHVDSWKSSKQSLISVFVFTVFISGGWEVFFFTVPQSELSRVTFGLPGGHTLSDPLPVFRLLDLSCQDILHLEQHNVLMPLLVAG